MPITVFFSWQADTEKRGGRNLIDRALERAAARISRDAEVEEAIRELAVDRDTKGVAGSPPIVDTIFKKIDAAAAFVPDLTFIAKRPDGRPTPNPNVLVEYGWALKSIGHGRIVPVMNTAYGEPTAAAMPFDMRHLRNPITYNCPLDLSDGERRKVRDQLSKDLESAIRAVLDSEEFKSSLPPPPHPPRFTEKEPLAGRGRFRAPGEPLGLLRDFRATSKVDLVGGPVCWFRMIPTIAPGRTWSLDELEESMNSPIIRPMGVGWRGYDGVRGADGYGIYSILGDDRTLAAALVYVFTTGEVWAIDTYWLMPRIDPKDRLVPQVDNDFRGALVSYGSFLERLSIRPPYKWVAGIEDLRGRHLFLPTPPNHTRFRQSHDGEGLVDVVEESGLYSPGDPVGPALKPFFVRLYESCGVSHQQWQDK